MVEVIVENMVVVTKMLNINKLYIKRHFDCGNTLYNRSINKVFSYVWGIPIFKIILNIQNTPPIPQFHFFGVLGF